MHENSEELASKLQKVMTLAKNCDVEALEARDSKSLRKSLQLLSPLSNTTKLDEAHGIGVSSLFIRREKVLSGIGAFLPVHDRELLPFIRMYRVQLKKMLNGETKEAAAEIVDLACKLVPYKRERLVRMALRKPRKATWLDVDLYVSSAKAKEQVVKSIQLDISNPFQFHVTFTGQTPPVDFALPDEGAIAIVDQLYDQVLKLYRKASAVNLSQVKKNSAVLDRIQRIAGPYALLLPNEGQSDR